MDDLYGTDVCAALAELAPTPNRVRASTMANGSSRLRFLDVMSVLFHNVCMGNLLVRGVGPEVPGCVRPYEFRVPQTSGGLPISVLSCRPSRTPLSHPLPRVG